MDIIAHALKDPEGNSVVRYEQRCCIEIFSKVDGKSKSLIEFGLHKGQPVIILYKVNYLREFLEENPSLKDLKTIEHNHTVD